MIVLSLTAISTILLFTTVPSTDSRTAGSQAVANGKIDNGQAPLGLAGCQMHYRDLHGSYTYTFQAGGRYPFAATHQSGKSETGREGSYRYVITGPGKATISFDNESVVRLSFKNLLHGSGTVDGDVRPFAFTITPPEGE